MEERLFFDVHCHAMNLSHPNLTALVRRMNVPFALTVYAPAASIFMRNKIEKTMNLLSIMENDLGNFFLIMESCLKSEGTLWKETEGRVVLEVGGRTYNKVIITPLLMDFGYKNMQKSSMPCWKPTQKPIADQVVDVFGGIRDYINGSKYKMLEIYPFLGINTKNYTQDQISIMLNKYFNSYDGTYSIFKNSFQKLSSFNGDIEKLGSNHFSGIKLYPPLALTHGLRRI